MVHQFWMSFRERICCGSGCVVFLIAIANLGSVAAQEPVTPENTELAELLASARDYKIRITKPDAVLKLREPPVLNFTNPERNQERGSVFVWMKDERPAVIGQFFCFDVMGRRATKHALHSLSAAPLEAKFKAGMAWSPQQPGLEWKSLADAPAVDSSRAKRLLQMRQLTRRFKVNLIDSKDKATELRLAPRPLFEYSAPKVGVTDGGIFSYVVARRSCWSKPSTTAASPASVTPSRGFTSID